MPKSAIKIKLKKQVRYQRLLSGAPQTKSMRSGYVVLKPGELIGEHSTESKEEVLVLLEGRARVSYGIKRLLTAADSVIYIRPYTKHNVKNIGKGLLRYVYVVSPA